MIFPRREDATNKELVLTIIDIQGFLERYGRSHTNWHETLNEVQARLEQADKALEQEPCEDAISRQTVYDLMRSLTRWCVRSEDGKFNNVGLLYDDVMFGINKLSPVNPQESKTEQFAKWVATEIFDDMWEYNKDAFAEIACRKLAKLGIVRAKGDKWELVEPQETETWNGIHAQITAPKGTFERIWNEADKENE